MKTTNNNQTTFSVPASLKIVGVFGASLGLIGTLLATLAYLPAHPDFSMFTTYLSDIGDTPGWPQVLFNSTTLIGAPIRYLIVILAVLRLSHLGAGHKFVNAILILSAISTVGTILMTAVPFSVGPTIHKIGIPLYFFGLVIWQPIVGVKEWELKVPRILPVLSFLVAVAFLVFFILVMFYEAGVVARTAAPIWQWMGFFISIAWAYAHSFVLSEGGE